MEAFSGYLIRSVIWLTGFTVIYYLFLRNERFFLIKRYFLIAGIIISFLFPVITLHYQIELPVQSANPANALIGVNLNPDGVQQNITADKIDYRFLLLALYLAGVIFLLIRVILHMKSLYKTINKTAIVCKDGARLVRKSGYTSSFSFFNYIFINSSASEAEAGEIMNHELVHVRQKHWFDLLLAELLRMFQWMNPFAWLYTGFIRVNHEYLADEVALQRTSNPAIYRAALVNQLFSSPVISFSNSFSYSLNKKRFDMMKKIITSPYRKLKILLVLPVFAIILYAFAKPEYHYMSPTEPEITINNASGINDGVVKGIIVNNENKGMMGVTVIVSGAPTGTISDQNGRFTIGNVQEGSSLVFAYSGYETQTLKADFSKEMTIRMKKDSEISKTVEYRYVPPQVTPPGQTPQRSPLIIIDGVISEKGLSGINPDNIGSVTVLKNESATAAYGEKGKDGVILVTLKNQASQNVQQEVRGIVLTEDGKPIPGVNIMNTGTLGNAYLVSSGPDGRFIIPGVQADAILMFSGPGYKRQNLKPLFTTDMRVIMVKDPEYKGPAETPQQRPEPLVVLDGVIVEKSYNEVRKELAYNFGMMKMISSKEAAEKYGDKGKNGVMEITSRKKAFEMGLKPPFPRLTSEDFPAFQGKPRGFFNDWIISQLKYPADAATKGIQGRVPVTFSVALDGSLSNIKVTGTPDPVLASAVTKVIESSPKWDPPKNKLVDESYKYDVTIQFDLPDKVSIYQQPFVVVEQMPLYPGGEGELLNFINNSIRYPEKAKVNKIEGRVIIRFAVTPQGNADDASVLKGVDPLLDAEALRVVRLLKGFKPGMQGGKAVSVWYMVPVNFLLQPDVTPK